MTKDNLADICKELIFGIAEYETKREVREILAGVSEELESMWKEA